MSIFSAKKQLSVSDLARDINLFIINIVHGVQERLSVWDLIWIFVDTVRLDSGLEKSSLESKSGETSSHFCTISYISAIY